VAAAPSASVRSNHGWHPQPLGLLRQETRRAPYRHRDESPAVVVGLRPYTAKANILPDDNPVLPTFKEVIELKGLAAMRRQRQQRRRSRGRVRAQPPIFPDIAE
jgi:hypothetical protein